ncbi:MAG TPA: amino acid transporter [Naasia sp.]
MKDSDVSGLFREFADACIRAWAAGGWAVDALVGRQTREHGDLDLAVDARDLPRLLVLLGSQGYVTAVDQSPARIELRAPDGRVVDVHPVVFGPDGGGVQEGLDDTVYRYSPTGFVTGMVAGTQVPSLSAAQQLAFRAGYPPRPVDLHDVALLTDLVIEAQSGG